MADPDQCCLCSSAAHLAAPKHGLAAGGACLALLNAALASGGGADWLTGGAAQSRWFMEAQLGLSDDEFAAGFLHIGQETVKPSDRPRPDIHALTTWIDA